MKVFFLTNLYPPNTVGGYERLCFEVAKAFVSRGHQVAVLTSDYGNKTENYLGQHVQRSLKLLATAADIYKPFECTPSERTRITLHNETILKKTLYAFQPDIILAWNLFFLDQTFINALEAQGFPLIYFLTDNWLINSFEPTFMQNYFTTRVFNHQAMLASFRTDKRPFVKQSGAAHSMRGRAIFSSHFMQELHAQAKFRFTGETVIYHGVNFPEVRGRGPIDRGYFLSDDFVSLLVAGRIVEIKGVHTAIQALPLIMKKLPHKRIKLTILGDAQDRSYRKRLHDQILSLGLSNVEFAPPVRETDLFDLFQSYDIYLFPSLYEPFSLTIIHALNSGIPIIASNAGGNPEIIHHMETGLLFPTGNAEMLAMAVVQLIHDNNLRRSISQRAQSISSYYSFERMLAEIERFLENTSL